MTSGLDGTCMQSPLQVRLVELRSLRPHEGVDASHLRELKREIESDGILKLAIAVDKDTQIILDGHHRFTALKELGCRKIPAVYVDYASSSIHVDSWRNDWEVTKDMVRSAGLSNDKLPPRTSKHMIKVNGRLTHILYMEKRVNLPLAKLKLQ